MIKAVNTLCGELRPHARELIDAFGVPENALGDARVVAEAGAGARMRTRLPRAEREQQMLDTARALFAARGYADVTMDAVAAEVGVTKPLLYNYFGNKEQLFLACMKPAADALVESVVSAVQGAADAPEALRAGIHAFFAFLDSDGEAWRVLHDESLPGGGEIAMRVGRVPRADGGARHRLAAGAHGEPRRRAAVGGHLRRRRGAGPLVAAHGRADRRAHRRALDSHDRTRTEDEMRTETRRVAVIGGNRIPFARSNGAYAHASDQDMLTAALDGLVERFALEGERLGEVVAGAVLKHARDRDLTRESVLGSKLAPETPAYDLQQACGTGLETTIAVANKIALGQIDVGIAGGVDTASDAPIAVNEDLRHILLDLNRAKSLPGAGADADAAAAGAGRAGGPAQRRAAHRAVDGRARGVDGARLGRHARRAGRADRRLAHEHGGGLRARVLRRARVSRTSGWSATRTCARTRRWRSWRSSSRCSAARTGR